MRATPRGAGGDLAAQFGRSSGRRPSSATCRVVPCWPAPAGSILPAASFTYTTARYGVANAGCHPRTCLRGYALELSLAPLLAACSLRIPAKSGVYLSPDTRDSPQNPGFVTCDGLMQAAVDIPRERGFAARCAT